MRRGDDGGIYPWGDDWVATNANIGLSWSQDWPAEFDDAWHLLESNQSPGLQSVGSFSQGISMFRVADSIGNAAEWVLDWYIDEGYESLSVDDPISLGPPWNHVVRGNGWFSRLGWEDTVAQMSRCSARSTSHSYDDPGIGFRCAQDLDT